MILTCMQCGTEFDGPPPIKCCDGRDCGCLGMPIDPLVCSTKCFNIFMYGQTPKWQLYREIVEVFGEAMIAELAANSHKGDRDGERGWLTYDDKLLVGELYYHVGKLQAAVKAQDKELIKELSADIANGALMVYDKYSPLKDKNESAI